MAEQTEQDQQEQQEQQEQQAQHAQVKGKVEYREGDGANIAIRPGPVQVQLTTADATLSWADGETRGSASMPIGDFRTYVAKGAIALRG